MLRQSGSDARAEAVEVGLSVGGQDPRKSLVKGGAVIKAEVLKAEVPDIRHQAVGNVSAHRVSFY